MMRVSPDIISLSISTGLLILYHLFLYVRLRRSPMFTIQAVNRAARNTWVEHVMESESRIIIAVQTLRNSTMAATFFASTAVLLMMGTLTLADRVDQLTALWQPVTGDFVHSGFGLGKVVFLVTDFFIAFFCFAISVRYYNHVSYQIGLPRSAQVGPFAASVVASHLNHGAQFYTYGMRAYYFAVPLVFWLFSGGLMIWATLALIVLLYMNDRAPRGPRVTPATV